MSDYKVADISLADFGRKEIMLAEEEKKIRQDPVGTGSAILRKVFGAL